MTLNIPRTDGKRVVVIGGGFGGLQLVKKLSRSDYQVVLVDRNNYHMFQPLLYQVATAAINPGDISFPYRKLFRGKKNVFFRMAEVERIDLAGNTIYTDRGELEYDYLVLANGSTTNFFGMDNIRRQAYTMKEVSEALAIRNRVLLHIEKAVELPQSELKTSMLNIVIVGGGATGVELAGAFASFKNNIMPKDYPEYHRNDINVYLIEGAPELLGTMNDRSSRKALEYLEAKGVEVLLGATVVDYSDGNVVLKDGRNIPTMNLIWTSGVTTAVPAGLDRFEKGRGGRLVTDMYFRLKGADNIFAIGDVSIQSEDERNPNGYPQLARVAMEQAAHLAQNLKRLSHGKLPEKFSYREYPVLATVGRNHAFAEYKKMWIGGFFAWLAWAGIHLFLILGVKNKVNIFIGWMWNYLTYDLPTRVVILPHGQSVQDDVSLSAAKPSETEARNDASADGTTPRPAGTPGDGSKTDGDTAVSGVDSAEGEISTDSVSSPDGFTVNPAGRVKILPSKQGSVQSGSSPTPGITKRSSGSDKGKVTGLPAQQPAVAANSKKTRQAVTADDGNTVQGSVEPEVKENGGKADDAAFSDSTGNSDASVAPVSRAATENADVSVPGSAAKSSSPSVSKVQAGTARSRTSTFASHSGTGSSAKVKTPSKAKTAAEKPKAASVKEKVLA